MNPPVQWLKCHDGTLVNLYHVRCFDVVHDEQEDVFMIVADFRLNTERVVDRFAEEEHADAALCAFTEMIGVSNIIDFNLEVTYQLQLEREQEGAAK